MTRTTLRDAAAVVAAGAGILLLADLALGWYEVKVTAGGITTISTTSSGWSDLGLVAGLLAIGMLVAMIRPLRHEGDLDFAQVALTAILGVGVFAFSLAAALTQSTSVTAPVAAVEVANRLWPAYAGIGLGAVVGVAATSAFVLFAAGARTPAHRLGAAHQL